MFTFATLFPSFRLPIAFWLDSSIQVWLDNVHRNDSSVMNHVYGLLSAKQT